jgi:subtilisin family serine protease
MMKICTLFFAFLMSFTAVSSEMVFVKNRATKQLLNRCKIDTNSIYVESVNISKAQLSCLERSKSKKSFSKANFFLDATVKVNNKTNIDVRASDAKVYALAKKEFGLPQFLKKYPTYDGRKVITGVIDDGISPHHTGFKKTTTGARKYLAHFSHSSSYTFKLKQNQHQIINLDGEQIKPNYIVIFDEEKYLGDFNGDEERTELKFAVIKNESGALLCHDLDLNDVYEKKDCQRSFSLYGEYGSWLSSRMVPLMAEIDLEKKSLRINEGEWKGDSHGEGVASVMAGHELFGKFDGVAPGAQIVDYDLSSKSFIDEESVYTIGKFLTGIATLAESGAEVINMSYSFYFHSAESQKAMSDALEELIERYNVLLVFSAGNNGPGLGSMNRSLIYPKNSLVAGAFISKEMDALVHGATGVDEQGQIVYYSSRGPGGDFGMGPTVISPLASITHSDAQSSTRSFSGTSSAAPALAGLGAVLISAIKQEGLRVDIDSVVSALKFSSKSLVATPYIFQGFGLPQIDQALELYKEIMNGDLPKFSFIGGTLLPRRDGVVSTGRLVRLEDAPSQEEMRLGLYSEFNFDTREFEDEQTLKIVELEYSHQWITGPERTWFSHRGGSSFSVTANYSELDREVAEHFGEVRVRDSKTNVLLAVFPVTVLAQREFKAPIKKQITLSPEKAMRMHFRASELTNGVQLNIDLTESLGQRITYRLYNKHGVKVESGSVMGGDELNTDHKLNPGENYQLAFSRYRGNSDITFSVQLKPILVKSKTSVTTTDGEIIIQSSATTTLKGYVGLRSKVEPVAKGFVKPVDQRSFNFSYRVKEKGSYSVKLVSPTTPDITYFSSRCTQVKSKGASDITDVTSDILIVDEDTDIGSTVDVKCFIFDLAPGVDIKKGFEYQVTNEANIEETWSRSIKLSPLSSVRVDSKKIKLISGNYQLFFETLNGAKIELGSVQIYPEETERTDITSN